MTRAQPAGTTGSLLRRTSSASTDAPTRHYRTRSSFGDFVVALEGSGGLSGTGTRRTSPLLSVSTILVGEHFHIRDGLVYFIAGRWTWLNVLNLPHQQS